MIFSYLSEQVTDSMKKKQFYQTPEAERFIVEFEACILSTATPTGESFDEQTGDEDMDDWM